MKIEKVKKEYVSLFQDVKRGQCFRHSSGGFYIKIQGFTSSNNNCINLSSGYTGICNDSDRVKIFENAEVVLGD